MRFKGLRDNLTCILDEELTPKCLCALHYEMHNTEQMLKSVGLIAHQIGSCQGCNEELSNFGPSNFKGDRISAKLRQGQQTALREIISLLPPFLVSYKCSIKDS